MENAKNTNCAAFTNNFLDIHQRTGCRGQLGAIGSAKTFYLAICFFGIGFSKKYIAKITFDTRLTFAPKKRSNVCKMRKNTNGRTLNLVEQ